MPGKKKVLYIYPGSPSGNNMVFAREIAARLKSRGFEVLEYYIRSSTNPVALILDVFKIKKIIRNESPCVIHAQYGSVTALISWLVSENNLIVSVRGSDINKVSTDPWVKNRLGRFLTKLSALWAKNVICVSQKLADQLYFVNSKCEIIPDGTDVSVFKPIKKCTARLYLGCEENDFIVLFYASRNPAVKGFGLVQEAFELVKIKKPNARLIVLNGDLTRDIVAKWMNAADCLAFASLAEGSPNVIREAMACNLPVVSVDVGDVVTRLAGVVPGEIIPNDAILMSDAILNVAKINCRSNGAENIKKQRITLSDTVDSLECIYKQFA